ncbi:MAG: hypothetical protein ACTSRZ_09715, partial [Promethearchaeota archaeon]
LYKKIQAFLDYIKLKNPEYLPIEILTTSIKKEYFYDSYIKIQKILVESLKRDIIKISPYEFHILNLCVKIILSYEPGVEYYLYHLVDRFNFKDIKIENIIDLLKYLNLINIKINEENFLMSMFKLSERAIFIKDSISNLQRELESQNNKPYYIRLVPNDELGVEDLVPIPMDSAEALFYIFSSIREKKE